MWDQDMWSERIEGWNEALFALTNADTQSPDLLVGIARALAESAPVLAGLMLVVLFVRRTRPVRVALLDATATALVGLGIAQIIVLLWYHPRPFELGLGHQFMDHAPEASFPSDHATLLFGLALPLLLSRPGRVWGAAMLALAVLTAWSRVYLGVHFPADMLGALIVAGVAAVVVLGIRPLLHDRVYPKVLDLYDWALDLLRLPKTVFPRRN